MSFLPDTDNWSLQSFSRIINLHCSGDSWVIQGTRAQIRAESLCHMPFINIYTYLRISSSSSHISLCLLQLQGLVMPARSSLLRFLRSLPADKPQLTLPSGIQHQGMQKVRFWSCLNWSLTEFKLLCWISVSQLSTPALPLGVVVSLHLQNSCLGPKGHPLLLAVRMLQKFLVLQGFSYFIRPEELPKWRTSIQPKV